MVLGRIFPKITKFYLDGSPAEAEIAYPDKVRRVHIRLGGQKEQITAGPEGVIYITKGYPSALQIKWALKLQKKKFLPYFKFFEAASLAYPDVSARLSQQDPDLNFRSVSKTNTARCPRRSRFLFCSRCPSAHLLQKLNNF